MKEGDFVSLSTTSCRHFVASFISCRWGTWFISRPIVELLSALVAVMLTLQVKCEVWSTYATGEVWSVKFLRYRWSVKCEVLTLQVKCEVWSVKYLRYRWRVKCEVLTLQVKCEVWSTYATGEEWSVKYLRYRLSVKCEVLTRQVKNEVWSTYATGLYEEQNMNMGKIW